MRTLIYRVLMGLAFFLGFLWLVVATPAEWVSRKLRELAGWAEIRWLLAVTEAKLRRRL